MFKTLAKIARKVGAFLGHLARGVVRAAENDLVNQYDAAEARIERRGTFGNLVGVLFDDEDVKRDIEIVRDYRDSVQAIRIARAAESAI